MQAAKLVLEEGVVGGGKDRWKVVNASIDLTWSIDRVPDSDGQPLTSVKYVLTATGERLEGRVIIVSFQGPATWQIFQIRKVHSGLAIIPVEAQRKKPAIGRWYWEGANCVWTESDQPGIPALFTLKLQAWGMADALSQNWPPTLYFKEVQRAAGCDPVRSLSDADNADDWIIAACHRFIADQEKIARLERGQTEATEIFRSIMGDDPQAPDHSGDLLALKLFPGIGPSASHVIERLHDAADALGIELGSGIVRRHERKPRRAR
jgi:hypothetical protein